MKLGAFCNSTIVCNIENNITSYILKNEHSDECLNIKLKNNLNINTSIEEYEKYKQECIQIMDNAKIYDRKEFREKFKDLYNKNNYKFEISDIKLNNLITAWCKNSKKFTKYTIFDNQLDYSGDQLLRDYRNFFNYEKKYKKLIGYEFIIWGNSENILRMAKSLVWFFDGTYHHPDGFEQLLLVMYKDVIISEKIVGLFILMNKKSQIIYNECMKAINNIVTQNNTINLNLKYIVTDNESSLVNSINNNFKFLKRISCFYHYKQDLLKNIKKYGLYKNEHKNNSNEIIKILGRIPIQYKGNMQYFIEICDKIVEKYPIYNNFIKNYFIKYKKEYFENNDYDYSNIPEDCKSISFLENYNKYLKIKLGKKRVINWFNFIIIIA